MDENQAKKFKGRGAQINTRNPFLSLEYVSQYIEGLDEPWVENPATIYYTETPKKVLNKVSSPDVNMEYSINPYQGCEHGCIYCYARNTHQYWGLSAGIDFETKIIVKKELPVLLENELRKKSWKPSVISISGNTDCYQPAERKFQITRKMLQVLLKFRNPVAMITKNNLILRDLDILKELAANQLVHVMVSITSLDESLRQKLEPRTVTSKLRLKVINELSKAGIPTGVMVAPLIPGLNTSEIPEILKQSGENGAGMAGYTIVRLNGAIGEIFTDWIHKTFPDKAEKVLSQIREVHGGSLNDSRWGSRMRGEGKIAESVKQLFKLSVKKHIVNKPTYSLNKSNFRVPVIGGQMDLFE